MPPLDDELRAALGRRPAPDGFADRLAARLARESARQSDARPRPFVPWRWRLAAAAAVLAMVAVGIVGERTRVERRNAAALRQTLSALSLAAAQLERAEKKAFAPERWPELAPLRSRGVSHLTPGAPLHSSDASPRT
jgi:hypothetical protein